VRAVRNCRIKSQTDGLLVKQVSHCRYLGSPILEDGYFDKKIHSTMTIDKKIFLDEKRLLTGNLNLELKKNITCLVQCIALYDTEIGMLIQADK